METDGREEEMNKLKGTMGRSKVLHPATDKIKTHPDCPPMVGHVLSGDQFLV